MPALAVYKFQLDMLVSAAYHLAGAVVIDVVGAEYGFVVIGTKGLELLEVTEELGCDILEVQVGVNVYRCLYLIRLNMG